MILFAIESLAAFRVQHWSRSARSAAVMAREVEEIGGRMERVVREELDGPGGKRIGHRTLCEHMA